MKASTLSENIALQRLAASNTPPEDDELDAIDGILKGPRGELDALSEELVRLQAAMEQVRAKQRLLQDGMRPFKAITSPIRRLPDDILMEIFLKCLPEGHYPTLDPLQAPLLLTHISRRWRFVAANTRRLWTSIHIPLPVLHIPSQSIPLIYAEDERYKLKAKFAGIADAFVGTVETWVSRIGGCGLSISLFQEDHQSREEDGCLHAVLEILVRRSHQWEHVDVAAPLRSVGSLVALEPDDVPSMKSFTACSTSKDALSARGTTSQGGFPFDLGGSQPAPVAERLPLWRRSRIFEAPLLESIGLHRIDEPLLAMPIDWSKLTSLVIEKQGTFADFGYVHRGIVIDVPVLATVLRHCTMLVHSRIALTPSAPEPPKNHESLSSPIELPHLVSLEFFEDRSCSASLFNIIDAPYLRKLEFQTLRKPEPEHGPLGGATPPHSFSLVPFLRRHGPKIQELTLDTQYILPFDRVRCWEALTGLKKLKVAPSNFSGVKYSGDEQGLLPLTNCDLQQLLMPCTIPGSPTSVQGGTESVKVGVVMPKLKSFECTTMSTLSDRGVLEFIRDRRKFGLKKVRLAYEKDWDKPVDTFPEDIRALGRGMDIAVEKKMRPSFIQPRQGLKVRCL